MNLKCHHYVLEEEHREVPMTADRGEEVMPCVRAEIEVVLRAL